jgi:uncharacterized protein with GYD domain
MPTYISLVRFTRKGAEDIKGGPGRLEEGKKAARARGGEIKAFYLVMGRYDAVLVIEAPSDEVAAAGALAAGARGYIRTETLRAFTEDEYRKMVATLP